MDSKKIVSKMTLQEKISLLCGSGSFSVAGVTRLNVSPLKMSDGPNGVKEYGKRNICFPSASILGCSWDENLIEEVGLAIGKEASNYGVDILLGPGLNIKRSPLCGRNFEYYSEDPILSGMLAAAYIRGVQSCGVCACIKHFAVNNQEKRRMRASSELDEQTLRETYLKSFELAVRYGFPKAVMSAYNKINGIYCSQNKKLLTEILRKEWGFDGVVVSDWCAVEDIVEALLAGLDIDMPGNLGISAAKIEKAVLEGKLPESVVNKAAERVVRIACRDKKENQVFVDSDEICLRAARESMVLLKNDGALPLKEKGKILVLGKFAQYPRYQGGGSANVGGSIVDITPLVALESLYDIEYIQNFENLEHEQLCLRARQADAVILFAGLDEDGESEGYDRKNLLLPKNQTDCVCRLAENGIKPIVVMQCGSAVETDGWSKNASAILLCGYAGQRCGEALAQIISGQFSPCGKLAETYPLRLEDTPAYLSFAGDTDKVYYGERMFVGYKHYDARGLNVSYPFGYGLTYTQFEYSKLQVLVNDDCNVVLSFDVCNVGKYTAKEIIQIYVGKENSLPNHPESELKAFKKVALQPGECKNVEISLSKEAFEIFDEKRNRFICFPGKYNVKVCSSSRDVQLSQTVNLYGDDVTKFVADKNTFVGEIWNRKDIKQMVLDFLLPYIKIWFTGSEEGNLSLEDPFVKNMVENMPLRAFAYFSNGKFNEDKLNEFLKKINDSNESGE